MPYYAGDYYTGDPQLGALVKLGASHASGLLAKAGSKALGFLKTPAGAAVAGGLAAGAAGALGAKALEAGGGGERRAYRRMNPFNFSAARRAIRRLSSFQKHAQKLYRFTGPRSRFKRPRKRR